MNKILVVTSKESERLLLEQMLDHFMQEGGEIFFADTASQALQIGEREKPKLIFVDENALGEDITLWKKFSGTVVLLTHGKKEYPLKKVILKPIQFQKIHQLCEEIFGKKSSHPSLPPM